MSVPHRLPLHVAPRALAASLLAIGCALCDCAPRRRADVPPRPVVRIPDEIHALLGRDAPPNALHDTTGAAQLWEEVREFYARRHDRPAWIRNERREPALAEFADYLDSLDFLGLDPSDYDARTIVRLAASRDDSLADDVRNRRLARLDVRASFAWMRLAQHLEQGRVPAAALDPDWTGEAAKGSLHEALRRALDRHEVSAALRAREPVLPGYRKLVRALADYRALAIRGGWPAIGPGPRLERGARGPRVARLVRRLAATGDLRASLRDTVYDPVVERAVGDFQSRHGIPRSGIVGDVTLAALDTPVETRLRTLALNLERWRWLPDSLGRRYIAVNLPAYRLDLVRGDSIERSLRVVVGRRRSPTPVFSDAITYLELNPTWTVPKTILVQEIVPLLKRKKDYLAANHMTVISIATAKRDTVDPAKVPWKDAASDSFLYLVVQGAGPDNPLGRLKFMCPNEYDVYLHDTPVRDRFGVAVRDFSHGCVRVADAEVLADSLLGRAADDTSGIAGQLAGGAWKRIRLPKPVPVHFLYWTSWVDDSSRVQFRDDLYGLDARLERAFTAGGLDTLQLNPGVALSPFWMAARAEAARKDSLRAAAKERLARNAARRDTKVSDVVPASTRPAARKSADRP